VVEVKYGAAPVDLIADVRAGTARIRVRDHGAGVPPEFVPRMFEPFTRSEQAKAGALAGSGLGLSIVATLAAEQGGEVSYEAAEPGACLSSRCLTTSSGCRPSRSGSPRIS
jgi:signal transduction histidine kinase